MDQEPVTSGLVVVSVSLLVFAKAEQSKCCPRSSRGYGDDWRLLRESVKAGDSSFSSSSSKEREDHPAHPHTRSNRQSLPSFHFMRPTV